MPSGANAARTNTAGSNNQQGKDPEQLQNCALCTAAALTGETSGVVNANLQKGLDPAKLWGAFQSDRAFTEYVTYDPSVQKRGTDIFGADILVPITPVEPALQGIDELMQNFGQMVAAQQGKDPNALAKLAELALPYQIVGLAVYVNGKLGNNVQWSMRPTEFVVRAGSGGPTRAKAAIPFMNSQPDGTKFAVYTASGGILWENPHWIYAEKEGGKVTFKDFQWDMQVWLTSDQRAVVRFVFGKNSPDAPGPVISENPLGPNGRIYTDGTNLMFVLAFGDNLLPVGQQ